ncbi:hypothetical protein AYI69_g3555 [Smittium culicis]|uniref:Uncharacterized protein n=1 Tax=Smittium culicis TaxID=133412 RepID=A0A1R1YJW3_9FUNG|nr:hypothetical protein AYI69_g3555 [Smittium culicis]
MKSAFIISTIAILSSFASSSAQPESQASNENKNDLLRRQASGDPKCTDCSNEYTVPYIYNIEQFLLDLNNRAYRSVVGRYWDPFYNERFAAFKSYCYKDADCNTKCLAGNKLGQCKTSYTAFTTSCKADKDCNSKCGF